MIAMSESFTPGRLVHTALLAAVGICGVGLAAPAPASGQMTVIADHDWCEQEKDRRDGEHVCEVREISLRATGAIIEVDARPNGGVHVVGEDRGDVLVWAKVVARAKSEDRAREISRQVEIRIDGLEVSARGPKRDWNDDDEHWWVSFKLSVPRQSDLDLQSTNGGISIADVSGDIAFRTTNGGVELSGLGGSVEGATTNGGLDISLSGSGWQGEGLDVKTTNGGIDMRIPEGYSARLETGTRNGGLDIDFPITLEGRIDRNELTTDLGSGGQTIRAITTNGGIDIRKS